MPRYQVTVTRVFKNRNRRTYKVLVNANDERQARAMAAEKIGGPLSSRLARDVNLQTDIG